LHKFFEPEATEKDLEATAGQIKEIVSCAPADAIFISDKMQQMDRYEN